MPSRSSTFFSAGSGASGKRHGAPAAQAAAPSLASGVRPYFSQASFEASTSAAAPSEIWLELAAVSTPSGLKAGRSLARLSGLVSGRTPWSSVSVLVSRRSRYSTPTISSAKAPDA